MASQGLRRLEGPSPELRAISGLLYLGAFVMPLVPALLVWLVVRHRSAFARGHCAASFNFQATIMIMVSCLMFLKNLVASGTGSGRGGGLDIALGIVLLVVILSSIVPLLLLSVRAFSGELAGRSLGF